MFSRVSKGSTGIKTSKIQNCRSHTKLFDKKDNFTFKIIRMPNKSSNIPREMFYLLISAETLRISKATTKCLDFLKSSNS